MLDLDHTLLDFSRHDESPMTQAKRPHLDARVFRGLETRLFRGSRVLRAFSVARRFLEASYEHYDLVIWSQTSWRWLEVKLTELGLLSHESYKISFVLDKTSMFRIISRKRDGSEFKHAVKPLQLIWDKTDFWDASNTVHVDDLSRNFALNPKAGIKCKAYHRSAPNAAQDVELPLLSAYLSMIATDPEGMAKYSHASWRTQAKLALNESKPLPAPPSGAG